MRKEDGWRKLDKKMKIKGKLTEEFQATSSQGVHFKKKPRRENHKKKKRGWEEGTPFGEFQKKKNQKAFLDQTQVLIFI